MDIDKSVELFELETKIEGLQAYSSLNPSLVDNLIFNDASKKIKDTFDKIKEDTTDPAYVGMKGQFPYIDGKYMEDKFDKYFPVSKLRFGNPAYVIVQNYHVVVFVEIDAYLTKDVFITRAGVGGSIMQVSSAAKEAHLKGERPLNPFDYVSIANAFKSALSNATANAQSKFKIGADMYKRIILSKEELNDIKKEIEFIRSKVTPRQKIEIKERYAKCNSAGDKVKLLHVLRDEFDVTEVSTEEIN